MASSQLLDTDKCTAVRTRAYDPLGSRGVQTISKVGGNKKCDVCFVLVQHAELVFYIVLAH
jgi:hypothetical protein